MRLKDALAGHLTALELKLLITSYDIVGDIAIIIIPPELHHRETLIGQTILSLNKRVKVVARRDGIYEGEYRTVPVRIIAGEDRKESCLKEFGVTLHLHIEEMYFSVRSGSERMRLARLVYPGENVLVLFSGIAPFPLILARHSSTCAIIGIEINRKAHEYGVRNLIANRAGDKVTLLHGDVSVLVPQLNLLFDRIIMPLPKGAHTFLPLAFSVLKQNGWLHYYNFQSVGRFNESIDQVRHAADDATRTILSSDTISCGHCGPRTYRVCVDARIG